MWIVRTLEDAYLAVERQVGNDLLDLVHEAEVQEAVSLPR
jgi:hypothetical protein